MEDSRNSTMLLMFYSQNHRLIVDQLRLQTVRLEAAVAPRLVRRCRYPTRYIDCTGRWLVEATTPSIPAAEGCSHWLGYFLPIHRQGQWQVEGGIGAHRSMASCGDTANMSSLSDPERPPNPISIFFRPCRCPCCHRLIWQFRGIRWLRFQVVH